MTFKRLILIYISSLCLSAAIFAHTEGKTFLDGFYWSCVTATTIGYGDLLPTQNATKITMIIFSHFWVFYCIPCVVALILGNIIKDADKFTHAEQEWQERSLQEIAKAVKADIPTPPSDT